jgi:hypothetical protein
MSHVLGTRQTAAELGFSAGAEGLELLTFAL